MADSLDKNPSELNDLVQKAVKGDDTAFGRIYDIYFEKVYRFIFYRVNHKQAAEDLVSETFIRAFNRVSEIHETGAFTGWIFQIARNLVIDYYRSREQTVNLDELENFLEYEDNLVDRANLAVQQKSFLEALKKLPASQQVVIKLKFIDNLENSEIAQILNKSEGAIRVIQYRAIAELKNLLDKANEP